MNTKKKKKLDSHKKKGNILKAPMNELPLSLMSWTNDRLPNMLWASLILLNIERKHSLEILREIGFLIGNKQKSTNSSMVFLGLNDFQNMDSSLKEVFFNFIKSSPQCIESLKPLMLFDSLPIKEEWQKILPNLEENEIPVLWDKVSNAVFQILEHQSQTSTDCRWIYILPNLVSKKLVLTPDMIKEGIDEELLGYPYKGDLRKVRPTIRSFEGSFANFSENNNDWSKNFWSECKTKTRCIHTKNTYTLDYNKKELIDNITLLWEKLHNHFINTDGLTCIQPKRDASFGFAFYSLTIVLEMISLSDKTILSKITLRMLSEIYITFKYLVTKNNDDKWSEYRSFGSGQAKLTFLKLDEVLDTLPEYINKEDIERIANEDMYMEFSNINIGNWDNSNLRGMSQKAGCKDIYDAYYNWTSTFAHGHWCAIRDSVFTTCLNPLHRLHRIPRDIPNYDNSSLQDAVILLNKILDLLNDQYPEFTSRLSLEDKSV